MGIRKTSGKRTFRRREDLRVVRGETTVREINLTENRNYRRPFSVTQFRYSFNAFSLVFSLVWLAVCLWSVYKLMDMGGDLWNVRVFTLALAALYSFLSSIRSLTRYVRPYLLMKENSMKLINSVLDTHTVDYADIKGTTYKNEIVGLVTYSGKIYNVTLSQLSEKDQRDFLLLLKNRMDHVRGIGQE